MSDNHAKQSESHDNSHRRILSSYTKGEPKKSLVEGILDVLSKTSLTEEGKKQKRLLEDAEPAKYQVNYDEADSACIVRPPISRRSFLGLTAGITGLLALESLTPGAVIHAFADEVDPEQYGFSITILSKEELGIICRDVTSTPHSDKEGVEVRVTSLFNNKSTEWKKSIARGVVVFNVVTLAEDPSPQAVNYSFWGSIEAKCSGYREYATGKVRLISGPPGKDVESPSVAMMKNDGNKPYARMLTYNGFDMQYHPAGVEVYPECPIDQEIRVQLMNVGNNTPVTLLKDNTSIGSANTTSVNGLQTAVFTGKYARDFSAGQKASVKFKVGSTEYTAITTLDFKKTGALAAPTYGPSVMAPGGSIKAPNSTELAGGLPDPIHVVIPSEVPIVGGKPMSLGLPGLPVYVYGALDGYIGIVVDIALIEFAKDNFGEVSLDKSYGNFVKRGLMEWLMRKINGYNAAQKRFSDANSVVGKNKKIGSAETFSESYSRISFIADGHFLYKTLDPNPTKGYDWSGDLSAAVGWVYAIEKTKQFSIAGFPVFVGFDVAFSLTFKSSFEWAMNGFFRDLAWKDTVHPISITAFFELGLSAGVGIAGFVSFAVRGYGRLIMALSFGLGKDAKAPVHFTLDVAAGMGYVAQFLFFTKTGDFVNGSWPRLYDSWRDSNPYDPTRDAGPGYLDENWVIRAGQDLITSGVDDEPWTIIEAETLGESYEGFILFDTDEAAETPPTITLDNNRATGEACSNLGIIEPTAKGEILSYNITDGVKPISEAAIIKNCASDPRVQIVDDNGTLYMLRLMTVKVKDGMIWDSYATRICVSKYNSQNGTWGAPAPIDFRYPSNRNDDRQLFDWKIPQRYEMFDYDYDVKVIKSVLHIMMISGNRPDGDSTSFADAQKFTLYSYVSYDLKTSKVTNTEHGFYTYPRDDDEKTILHSPRVTALKDTEACAMVCESVYDKKSFSHSNIVLSVRESKGELDLQCHDKSAPFKRYNVKAQGNISEEIVKMDATNGFGDRIVFSALVAKDGSHESIRFISFDPVKMLSDVSMLAVSTGPTEPHALFGSVAAVGKYRQGTGWFVYPSAVNETTGVTNLTKVRQYWNELNFTAAGTIEKNAPFGISEDGDWLFTTLVKEGKKDGVDIAEHRGVSTVGDDVEVYGDTEERNVQQYQIYGARKFSGFESYSSFFPVAQLENRPDSLSLCQFSEKTMGFVFNNITDVKKGKSDIYFTSIPFVNGINLVSASMVEYFAGVGDTVTAVVNVENVGNLALCEFSGKITRDKEGTDVVHEFKIETSPYNMVDSVDMFDVEQNVVVPTAADKEGVFLPGTTRVFKTEFKIPQGWHGTIELYAFVHSSKVAEISEFPEHGEDIEDGSLIKQWSDPAAHPLELNADGVSDTFATLVGNEYDEENLEDPKPLADTGDNASNAAKAAALAALAAAAGVGGYAAHRLNSGEASGDDE